MVDRSDLYPGAVVTVPAEFARITDDVATVAIRNFDGTITMAAVHLSSILSVEDRPLAVGDRVRTPGRREGEVKCIEENEAAVLLPHGAGLGVFSLSSLTRIPEDAEEPAPCEKAVRFKVGDSVFAGGIGRGKIEEIIAGKTTPYLVNIPVECRGWFAGSELRPAEERAP